MSWVVSQKSLHLSRTLSPGAGRSSLFPLFDSTGRVEWLMVVREGDKKIALVRWERDLLTGFAWWRRLSREWASLAEASDQVLGMDRLWHFDPWWVLGESRFAEHPAKAVLKETNLPAYDSWKEVWYSRDLGRVRYVLPDGHHQPELFDADRLRALEPQRRPSNAVEWLRRGWPGVFVPLGHAPGRKRWFLRRQGKLARRLAAESLFLWFCDVSGSCTALESVIFRLASAGGFQDCWKDNPGRPPYDVFERTI